MTRPQFAAGIRIRAAALTDVPALARVHVRTFNEAHTLFGLGFGAPSVALRESQWKEKLAERKGLMCCFVAEDGNGEMVGFANGNLTVPEERGDFTAHLEKIYVLRTFHRAGIGRRLMGHVIRHFIELGATSVNLFSQANNPSIGFFERLGGERLITPKGEFHGGYGWRDLQALAARTPLDGKLGG